MQYIHYHNDFTVPISLVSDSITIVPEIINSVIFYTRKQGNSYCCCWDCKTLYKDDNYLYSVLNGHNLEPGVLKYMVEYQIPDSNYPDGFLKICQHYTSDIELTTQNGDITIAEAQIIYGETIEQLLESAGYSYTKEEVDEMIAQLDLDINTYSKAEIDLMIANVEVDAYTKSETDTLLSGKADSNSVYTKTESDNKYLTSQDISQLANKSEIPTKTSQLQNDSNFVSDNRYVHTDNNYTTTEKSKLSGIASGAEVNVQSDWNVTNTSSDAFIKNKPTIPSVDSSITGSNQTNPVQGGAIYDALQGKTGYKSYSSYQAMVADDPANGTIGWDGNEEIFYIYDEGNCDWRRIDNNIVSSITSGSSNAVTGGAIYSALAGKTGNIWYNSYNDMIADSPANGTIGFESDYEHFYIYDSANDEWKQIDQAGGGVQSNWNETDTSSLAYIQNKPTIPTKTSDLTNDSNFINATNNSNVINATTVKMFDGYDNYVTIQADYDNDFECNTIKLTDLYSGNSTIMTMAPGGFRLNIGDLRTTLPSTITPENGVATLELKPGYNLFNSRAYRTVGTLKFSLSSPSYNNLVTPEYYIYFPPYSSTGQLTGIDLSTIAYGNTNLTVRWKDGVTPTVLADMQNDSSLHHIISLKFLATNALLGEVIKYK